MKIADNVLPEKHSLVFETMPNLNLIRTGLNYRSGEGIGSIILGF